MAFQEGFHPFGGIVKTNGNDDSSGGGNGLSFGTPHEVIFVNYDLAIEMFGYEPGGFIALPQGPDDPDFSNAQIECGSIESLTVGDDMLAHLWAFDFNQSPCIAAGLTVTISPTMEVDVESLESSHPIYVLQPVMRDEYPPGYDVIDVPDASIEVVDIPYTDGFYVSVIIPDIGEELPDLDNGGVVSPILAINVNSSSGGELG